MEEKCSRELTVHVKVEPVEETNRVIQEVTSSSEQVIKTEPSWPVLAVDAVVEERGGGGGEGAAGLYADHVVKGELELGPERLHRPGGALLVSRTMPADRDSGQQPHLALKDCTVRLERIPFNTLLARTETTSKMEEIDCIYNTDSEIPYSVDIKTLSDNESIEEGMHTGFDSELPCYVCSKRFTHKSDLMKHIPIHIYNPSNELDGNVIHSDTEVDNEVHVCDICGKIFDLKLELMEHVVSHIYVQEVFEVNVLSPVCGSARAPLCSLPDVSASARARRQLAAACAVRLERLRESRAPRAQQHTYCCDMCTGQFNTKSTLIRHIRTHYRYADCRKAFMMSSSLSRHEPNCTENKRKKRELTETSALTRSHGEVLYSCDEYGKGFRIKSYLRKHIQKSHIVNHLLNSSHSSLFQNPKRHTQMSRTNPRATDTSYKVDLKRHRKNHTREKRFKCNYCDFKCHKKSNLQTHRRIHTGEMPFKCDRCDYKCSFNSKLQTHQRIHTGEKSFKCSYCDYKCHQKCNLQTHQRIHTGEKPFKCGYCDYKFNRKSHLQSHQRIHTGEKPFKCIYCDYKCNQKPNLKTHLRIHTGEKPFKCGYCDYKCSDKSSLRHHQSHHQSDAV